MNRYILILLNFCICSLYLFSENKFALGVNLDDNGAFVNIINHTNRYSGAVGYDSLGWPTSDFDLVLLDGRPATEWNGTIDDPEQYRIDYSGTYHASFRGLADVSVSGTSVSITNKTYDPQNNYTYFDLVLGGYPNANHGLVFIKFTNTFRSPQDKINSGITELKVIRPGYPLNSEKTFTDEYLNLCKSANFACYRFYGVQNIWDGEPVYPAKKTWDKRKTPQDASQRTMKSMNGKSDAWCWEYVIELANILKKDIWINIYMSADSDYVANLAGLLKTKLNPEINIYVENSNEVWSPTQATHGPYNKAEADKNKITFDENYARRTIELSRWFTYVFGQSEVNKRIRIILASQHAYSGRSDNHLNYIKSKFGEPKDYIYATSPALYFGSTKATSTDPILINEGMIEDINSQISNSQVGTYRLNHINKANKWGLIGGCTSYEGGPSLPEGGATANLANQILANRTEKMKDVVKKNYLEGWKNIGGGLAMYFTLTSAYNRYGCWGITDDYTKPDRNYKMQAIRDIISTASTSESELITDDVEISPNPVSDFIEIYVGSGSKPAFTNEIKIYSIYGQSVLSVGTIQELPLRIDVSMLTPGMYYIRTGNSTAKFIKL